MTDIPEPARRLRVTLASSVQLRRVRWLWDRRIMLGGLTLLAGREGIGKSAVSVDLAARVTHGLLDGETKGLARNVIYVHSEDARDYTVAPRLVAAGADLDRVAFLDAITPSADGEIESPLVLPLDAELLADTIRDHDAALVVLDAATSVIDARLNGDKDRQMRIGLERIARIGQATGAAILGIVHFGKRESADTGKLILGSIAWSQVARSVLAAALDEDAEKLIISPTKHNLGPPAQSLRASIVSQNIETAEGTASVARVEWLGETDQDARDLLGPVSEHDEGDTQPAIGEAAVWLRGFLAERGGSAPFVDVLKAARTDDIAERTLRRAAKKIHVKPDRTGFGQGSIWRLLED
ncbi:MAG: AAA family ATPase [Pseudonocardiaceae bacterium]